ncbi:unnamed protein product [Gadus morhua 'NCC']
MPVHHQGFPEKKNTTFYSLISFEPSTTPPPPPPHTHTLQTPSPPQEVWRVPLPIHPSAVLCIRHSDKIENGEVHQRRRGSFHGPEAQDADNRQEQEEMVRRGSSWRRIMLLILAITIHNIPEGLAVGVAFGAIGKTPSATFESARNLAIGIGIQNFPEGLAVSLPLRGAGMSTWGAFWYGQLSGMVEPVAGLLGAVAVVLAEPLLPYALAFAAGAMVYVVVDDIIPEAQVRRTRCHGNGRRTNRISHH